MTTDAASAAFRVGGDFFKPANGRYIGIFKGVANGPVQNRPAEDGKPARTTGTIRWLFDIYNLDGTPVLDPSTGTGPASVDGLSSDSVGIGRGVPAKGRLWLRSLLAAKDLQFMEPGNGEDVNRMVQAAIGAQAVLTFGNNTKGIGGTLKEIEAMPATALAAPAPAPVAAPVAEAPVPQVVAPQPVPVATPFVPGGSGTAPMMPFPTA